MAEKLINEIAESYGYLGEKFYAPMPEETRLKIQKALLSAFKGGLTGASVTLLAKEIYSKDINFISELLRNADNNQYTKALAAGTGPYIAFGLHEKKLVIECNEDGFTEADVRAICDVGKSSSGASHGYTGIGFKSVFKVAWKVHIQSGDYSFVFVHREGDSGMGMIAPEWEPSSDQPSGQVTRITLHLIDDGATAARRQGIREQLDGLDANVLLFSKSLQRIHVSIFSDGLAGMVSTTVSVSPVLDTHLAVMVRCKSQNGVLKNTNSYFFTGKFRLKSAVGEIATTPYEKAGITVAFPLKDANFCPIVEPQQIYSFLPICHVGFNFLIHADFITATNGEDILESAQKNHDLSNGIASAVVATFVHMYRNPTLRYQWMRYLGNLKSYPWDPFWAKLVDKISTKLNEACILRPRDQELPSLIRQLKLLGPMDVDKDGNPFFEDCSGLQSCYISTKYRTEDLLILKDYGLTYMDTQQLIDRLELDLVRDDSRMKNQDADLDWHIRVARRLNHAFKTEGPDIIDAIKSLDLLPLSDGRWVSITAGQVFFPVTDDGTPLPHDLGLRLCLLPVGANLKEMRLEIMKLYVNLGVVYADVEDVRSLVAALYGKLGGKLSASLDLDTSYAHLVFMYRTHKAGKHGVVRHLRLVSTQDRVTFAVGLSLFPSDEPYSLWHFAQKNDDTWLKANASFIHTRYLESPMPQRSDSLSWRQWLEMMGVRTYAQLPGAFGSVLSKECLHVARTYPSDFLDFLRLGWPSQQEPMLKYCVLTELKQITVPCQGFWRHQLSKTYLPLPRLQEACTDVGCTLFPALNFLRLKETLSDEDAAGKWSFLTEHLGVGSEDDVRFYVDLLFHCRIAGSQNREGHERQILKVCARIHQRCLESKNQQEARECVQKAANERQLVYVPLAKANEAPWVSLQECVLDAPTDEKVEHPIVARYEAAFAGMDVDLSFLPAFFQETLGIRPYSWEDGIQELVKLKGAKCFDPDRFRAHYVRLNYQCRKAKVDAKKIRQAFEQNSLVIVQDRFSQYRWWVPPSKCMWSDAVSVRYSTNLKIHYDHDLDDFFVAVLKVPCYTTQMIYDELAGLETGSPLHAKDYLLAFNTYLGREEPSSKPDKLLKRPFLPVRFPNGDVRLVSADTDFAIVDRQPLELLFRDKIKLLDFSLEQTHMLKRVIDWTNLGGRYLSRCVKETSEVDMGSTQPLSDPTREIRKRALALTRIAVHLDSPRVYNVQGFFYLLYRSRTLETDKISSRMTIVQNSIPVSVQLEQSLVHIQDSKVGGLTVYVPHDEVAQEVCFSSALPEKLVRWMMTDPETQVQGVLDESAVKVVTSILATRSEAAMSRILDMQGIVNLEVHIPKSENEDDHKPTKQEEEEKEKEKEKRKKKAEEKEKEEKDTQPPVAPSSAEPLAPSTLFPVATPAASPIADPATPADIPASPAVRALPIRSPPPAAVLAAAANEYRRLLEHAIQAARSTELPRYGAGSVSSCAGDASIAFDEAVMFPLSAPQRERYFKIGTVGELFVFELLSAQRPALAGFTRENWMSTARKYATVHPSYADMQPWTGRETSDITYNDQAGTLTGLLVDKGYLAAEWRGRRLQYYVEVKATFAAFDAPFYMSQKQYEKMSLYTSDKSVYVIFRIFQMTSGSIGARLYVDPDRMRRDGRLSFSSDKWTVKPRPEA